MNIAMILAMLLASGVCARTSFEGPGGTGLDVIVCPVMQAAPAAEDEPGEPS